MTAAVTLSQSQSIFERLSARGITAIEYVEIKAIMMFDLPERSVYFERHFRGHTPAQAIRLVWQWKKLLKKDFILAPFLTEERIQDLRRAIESAEILAWTSLLEVVFLGDGEWKLYLKGSPKKQSRPMDTTIVAINQKTGETRKAFVRGTLDLKVWVRGLQDALADINLLKVVLNAPALPRMVSAGPAKSWPICTQVLIPRLYEFMLPFYRRPGHSGPTETKSRSAYYPKELFEDMLAILQIERPEIFQGSTAAQLLASVQRFRKADLELLNS